MQQGTVIRTLVWALLSMPISMHAYADGRIQLIPLERQLVADKRGIVTLRFEVENRSAEPLELQEYLQLPDSWSLLTTPAPFLLAPAQRDVRLLHILIPRQSPAGQFPVAYQLASLADNSLQQQEEVYVDVQETPGIHLSRQSAPANLLAGEAYEASFLLKNTGNNQQPYRIRLYDEDGFAQRIEPQAVTLAAGASQTIRIRGQVSAEPNTDTHRLTVVVDGPGEPIEEQLNIPIISRIPNGVGSHHLLYGELATGYSVTQTQGATSQDTQQEATLDYRLRGALDSAGEHRIDLHARTGRAFDQPFTAAQTQYQAQYENDAWRVKAGHQSFFTHRLTGNGLSGEGVAAQYQHPNREKGKKGESASSVRVFHGQSPEGRADQEVVSAVVGQHRFEEQRLEISASALHYEKDSPTAGRQTKDISSLETRWSGEQTDVGAAIAHDGKAKAVALDTHARQGNLSANLNYVQGDTGFQGAYADTEQLNVGGQWQANDTTRVSALARRSRTNLSENTSLEIREDQEYKVRVDRAVGAGRDTLLGVGIRHRHDQDLRETPTTDQTLTAATLSYQRSFDALTVNSQLEIGKRSPQGQEADMGSRQQLTLSWHPEKRWDMAADYSRDDGLENSGTKQALGVRGTYRLPGKQEVSGYLQVAEAEGSQSTTANLAYQKTLKQQRKLSLRASHKQTQGTTGQDSNDSSVQVDYTLPLDLPLRRRKDIASLCGQLVDAGNRLPLSGMVLRLEQYAAVTDAQGKFCYPNILAKTYRLQLDPSRLRGQSYMLGDEGLSKTIRLQAGDQQNLRIALYPAAGVNGQLLRWDKQATTGQAELKAGEGIANVSVELRPLGNSTAQPQQRTTDAEGRFSLLGLAAGRWQLVINDQGQLPKHYRLEQNQWALELKAGKTEELNIRALPKEQGIERTGPAEGFSVSG